MPSNPALFAILSKAVRPSKAREEAEAAPFNAAKAAFSTAVREFRGAESDEAAERALRAAFEAFSSSQED